MKKLLYLFLLFPFLAKSQQLVPRAPVSVIVQDANLFTTFNLKIPVYADTTAANLLRFKDSIGLMIFARTPGNVYVRDTSAGTHKWSIITGSGGAVDDVFGRTGHVVATSADYSSFYPLLSGAYNDPTWINTLSASKISMAGNVTAGSTKITLGGTASGASLQNFSIDVNQGNLNLASIGGLLGVGQINATGTPSSSTVLYGDGTWGAAGGGGTGLPNSNVGTGYRWAIPTTNNIKTAFGRGYIVLDSTSNTNGITFFPDTSAGKLATQSQLSTASNGLTKIGLDIQLGGTLSKIDTLIETGTNSIKIIDSGSATGLQILPRGTGGGLFVSGASSVTGTVGSFIGTGTGVTLNANNTNATTTSSVLQVSNSSPNNSSISSSASAGAVSVSATSSNGTTAPGVILSQSVSSKNVSPFTAYVTGSSVGDTAYGLKMYWSPAGGANKTNSNIGIASYFNSTTTLNKTGSLVRTIVTDTINSSFTTEFRLGLANAGSDVADKLVLSGSGALQLNGYSSLATSSDSTTYKPLGIDASGNVKKIGSWIGSGLDSGIYVNNTITKTITGTSIGLKVDTSVIATKSYVNNLTDSFTLRTPGTGTGAIPYAFTNAGALVIPKHNFLPPLLVTVQSDSLITHSVDTSNGLTHLATQAYADSVAGAGGGGTSTLTASHIFMGNTSNVATDTVFASDINTLPEYRVYHFAKGVAANDSIAGRGPTYLDSNVYYYTNAAGSGKVGGWQTNGTSGDSVKVTAPFWVVIGDSQVEGYPSKHGRLHQKLTYQFQYNYPDSAGQLSYELRQITHMRFYNQGIGGQTTYQVRTRFLRDALGFYSFPANDVLGTAGLRQSLLARPMGVVIVAGINDPFTALMNEDETKANLEWMASQCQQYGVRCVVLNLPGDTITQLPQLRYIADINTWLNRGALSQYGAAVVDYNSWWNDPAFGNDNHHRNSARIADDIHPKNTTGGYDSLAAYIVAQAKIPILTKAVFIDTAVSGFTGYNFPTGITINGGAYTLSHAIDTIAITDFVPDSVWIKITSSSGAGTTTGFGNIQWLTDNNPTQAVYYTKRKLYQGTTKANSYIGSLEIQSPDYTQMNAINVHYADSTSAYLVTTGSYANIVVNGGLTPVALNSAQLSLYGSASNFAISAQGKIKGAADSQFGSLEVGSSSAATTTGFGIGIVSGAVRIDGSAGNNNSTSILLNNWSAFNASGNSGNASHTAISPSINNMSGHDDTTMILRVNPTLNNATKDQKLTLLGGIDYSPTITAQGAAYLWGFRNTVGNNHFNTISGRTTISGNNKQGSASLEVNGTRRGLLPPRMTTAQRDSIGYVKSITMTNNGAYTVAPVATLSGGQGTGAILNAYISTGTAVVVDVVDPGYGWTTSSVPTVNFTGGTGSGAAATAVLSGPDSGLVIFNTTTRTMQVYNGSAWNDMSVVDGGRSGQTTLVSGTKAITINGLTTSSRAFVQLVSPSGTTSTVQYQAVCTSNTLTIQANVAAGTINTADGSTLNYFVIN